MTEMTLNQQRELIIEKFRETIRDFFVADREEDHALPAGVVQKAIRQMEPSIAELTFVASEVIREHVPK